MDISICQTPLPERQKAEYLQLLEKCGLRDEGDADDEADEDPQDGIHVFPFLDDGFECVHGKTYFRKVYSGFILTY